MHPHYVNIISPQNQPNQLNPSTIKTLRQPTFLYHQISSHESIAKYWSKQSPKPPIANFEKQFHSSCLVIVCLPADFCPRGCICTLRSAHCCAHQSTHCRTHWEHEWIILGNLYSLANKQNLIYKSKTNSMKQAAYYEHRISYFAELSSQNNIVFDIIATRYSKTRIRNTNAVMKMFTFIGELNTLKSVKRSK